MEITFSSNYKFVLINGVLFEISIADKDRSCSKCMYKRYDKDSPPRCFNFLKDVGEDTSRDKYRGFLFCYSNIFTKYLDGYINIEFLERIRLCRSINHNDLSLFMSSYLITNKCNINFNNRIII